MALINCPECKREVSNTAVTCPHCGFHLKKPEEKAAIHPIKTRKKSRLGIVFKALGVIGVIVILAALFVKYKPSSNVSIPPATVNQYTEKYAGGYTIVVKGNSGESTEAYDLRDNGRAIWMWTEPDGRGGVKVGQKDKGTWSATDTTITIKMRGRMGLVVEEYVLQNGVLVNSQLNDRYLKPKE
jgi:hypothetical protein